MAQHLTNITPSELTKEIVALAAKHTGVKVFYREQAIQLHEMDWIDQAESYDNGYTGNSGDASIWYDGPLEVSLSPFWDEVRRLEGLITKPLDEPILADAYPVYQGYFYVVDGKPRMFIDGENMTVGKWKLLKLDGVPPVTEVRGIDIGGRILRHPLKKEPETAMQSGWNAKGNHMHQRRRKPRCSNKIKKVMRHD